MNITKKHDMKPITLALAMVLSCGGTLAYAQTPDAPQPTENAPSSLLTVPSTPPGFAPIPGLTDQYADFRGMFTALTDPKIISATQLTQLSDEEEVLGLTLNGQNPRYQLALSPGIISSMTCWAASRSSSPIATSAIRVSATTQLSAVSGGYSRCLACTEALWRWLTPVPTRIWSHIAGEALPARQGEDFDSAASGQYDLGSLENAAPEHDHTGLGHSLRTILSGQNRQRRGRAAVHVPGDDPGPARRSVSTQ